MPKTERLTPYTKKGRQGHFLSFWRADGTRATNVRLDVDSAGHAQIIADGLAQLRAAGAKSPEDCPHTVPSQARRLYWRLPVDGGIILDAPATLPAWSAADIDRIPTDLRRRVQDLRVTAVTASAAAARMQLERDEARADLRALEASMLARAAAAARRCPPVDEAIALFERQRTGVTPKQTANVAAVARAFAASLPAAVRNMAQVAAAHIDAWLHQAAVGAQMPNSRRHAKRQRLGVFVNWSARQWDYPSQMPNVKGPAAGQVRRERGAIQVHTLAEIQAAIEAMPDAYWKALVGALAYAGLRHNEVRFLRPEDYIRLPDGRRALRVVSVEMGDGTRHLLKTARSERTVPVSAPLQTLVDEYLATGAATAGCLFPARLERRRMRGRGVSREQWQADVLTRRLNGSAGEPGLLPQGMTARALRRSIATLWRQRGMDPSSIALLLGNTTAVTVAHYAAQQAENLSTEV